jgi:dipeptidyl-peptidase-3
VISFVLAAQLLAANSQPASPTVSPLIEQVGETGFYEIKSPSFAALTRDQRLVALSLYRAAVAIDPIIYDQLSSSGLQIKKLIGALVEKPDRLPPASREGIVRYAKLFFANRGNHNERTNAKFLPEVGFEDFRSAAIAAQKAGAHLPEPKALAAMLEQLRPALFDPAFEPTPTAKSPPAGKDIISGSSNTFYGPGISLADLKGFQDAHALNSRVVKENGRLVEQVYRAGTAAGAVAPGLYAKELGQAAEALEAAIPHAGAKQQAALKALARYFRTGDRADWIAFDVAWVQDDEPVDFANGFIETYRDARAAKGSSQSLVSVTDQKLNPLMQKLAANALYFEKRAPWLDLYKKLDVKPPVGKAIEVLVETGDFHVSTIGDNLPNEEEIHRQYGTKNFLMSNATEVFNQTRGAAVVAEFAPDDAAQYAKVGSMADLMHTAMHEIIGHGSGKSRVTAPPRETLREYYSTLEEARADLVAYWNIGDPKLAEVGVADQPAVAREMYEQLARMIFATLNNYKTGDTVEEDHDRDRMLIWNWVQERGGIGLVEKGGKHYAVVLDWNKAHAAVGALLAELMRIKAEGDYPAIQKLVHDKGIRFDPRLRDEVVARYQRLGLPTFSAGVYGQLMPVGDAAHPTDATLTPSRDFLRQQLDFARENGTLGFVAGAQ